MDRRKRFEATYSRKIASKREIRTVRTHLLLPKLFNWNTWITPPIVFLSFQANNQYQKALRQNHSAHLAGEAMQRDHVSLKSE